MEQPIDVLLSLPYNATAVVGDLLVVRTLQPRTNVYCYKKLQGVWCIQSSKDEKFIPLKIAILIKLQQHKRAK